MRVWASSFWATMSPRWALSATTCAAALLSSCSEQRQQISGPTEGQVATIEISPTSLRLTAIWAREQLTAVAKDAQGNTLAGKTFAWTSSVPSVATVDSRGLVTAVSNGTATITATVGTVSGDCAVQVAQQVATVEVSPGSATLVLNQTLSFRAWAADENGNEMFGTSFSWTSSDLAVATVDTSGLVTAVAGGSVDITAAVDGVEGSAAVTVSDALAQRWEFRTAGAVYSSPAVAPDGTVYVGSNDGKLHSINPDGSKHWEFVTGGMVGRSSPAVGLDGTIYVGSNDGKLYAVSSDGGERWHFETGGAVESSPAIGSDGTIYVGSLDHKLHAINPDGSKKWEFVTRGRIYSSPAIASDGTIYVGSNDSSLYAVNPDGSGKWWFPTRGAVYSSPAIGADGTVYVGSFNNDLYAVAANGTKLWEFATPDTICSSPAVAADGRVYVGTNDHEIYAIAPNGSQLWSFTTGGPVRSSPAIGADGTVYAASDDQRLYAINQDGTKRWEFLMEGDGWSSPSLGVDGTVYVGSMDFRLYALDGRGAGLANAPWPKFRRDLRNTGNAPD